MDELLTLEAVSAQTRVPVRMLREWCATGRLPCEREGSSWVLAISDLARVRSLAAGRNQPRGDGRPVAIVVPADKAPHDLAEEVARRLGMTPASVAMSRLAIDGQDYVVAVWKDGQPQLPEVARLAEEIGGELLEGDEAPEPASES